MNAAMLAVGGGPIVAMVAGKVSYDQVKTFEKMLARMPQLDFPTRIFTGGGLVTRVMLIPEGYAVTGKRHLQWQHTILISGTVKITVDDGVIELTGPEVFVAPPGTKRIAFAVTDVVIATTLICDKTTEAEIEDQVIDKTDILPIRNLEGLT